MKVTQIPFPEPARLRVPESFHETKKEIQNHRTALMSGITITVELPPGGRPHQACATIDRNDPNHYWIDKAFKGDKGYTHFCTRINAAALALFREQCFGEFDIKHHDGVLTICKRP